ncbi:hypothetical protein A33M_3485 [Rhodovulum sp. PH10]|uniref:hypothetical protein n=1 Tax=Rhodovulum sp. PH10 TaxID=1187851 RepID=UPI00027C1F7C|nr:hypothetical protein [Rhodovulum sp. PH10]EJW13501.1 hypothetical protein A33M_3485 [Rhodovulum sp. PH10]
MTEGGLLFGIVLLARGDPRLVRATLASIEAWTPAPARVVLAVPKGREHAFAALAAAPSVEPVTAADADLVPAALAVVAPHADIVVVTAEGVVFDTDWLDRTRAEAENFQDVVGVVDLVHRVVKITTDGDDPRPSGTMSPGMVAPGTVTAGMAAPLAVPAGVREPRIVSALRALIRARSLMGAIFWARIAALRQIRIQAAADGGDVVAFACALDQLRSRGRTRLGFTRAARHVRLLPERRTGFDAGYGVYRRIEQLAAARQDALAVGGPLPVHLDPRVERVRLIAEQAVRSLGGAGKHNATTFLKGALAARRDAIAVRRTVVRDLRELR